MSRGDPVDPRLTTTRDAPLGGQAVLEGVMMRGVGTWSVAVRRPTGAVAVTTFALPAARGSSARRRLRRLPIVRGAVALWGSTAIGLRALSIAAAAQLPGSEAGAQELSGPLWAGVALVSLSFAVGLFFVVPVSATSLVRRQLGSSWLFWLVEGALRTALFAGYLLLVARMRELRRLLEYHGAEHKVIACHEAGDALTPERAARYPRLHPRCGTSFLLVVMLVSVVVFAPIGLPAWWILVLTRVLGVPIIAGIAYELLRLAVRHRERAWVRGLMAPGLCLQRLTTREPDPEELAVAIAALEAVLAVETPGQLAAAELVGLEVVA